MTNPKDLRKTASKVNTTPKGLQDLLGNVNQGTNPHELDHKISPIVDLYRFWTVNKVLAKFATAEVAGTVGQGLSVPVPEGELWQIVAASCAFELGGTNDETMISVGILDSTLTTMISFYQSILPSNLGTATNYQVAGGVFPDSLILSGGWNIRGQVDCSILATARTMTLQILYKKLTE